MESHSHNDIEEKFLERNDLFALKFHSGLVFLQVEGWESNKYEPHTQISSIGSQSDSGWTKLNDPDGDDILHMGNNGKKVLHASVGHYPSELMRYTNYPESENRLRTIPNLSVQRPSNGDTYGFIDGNDSPYESPSDAQELMIPPGVHLDFNFYNPNSNKSRQPVLNISMREYSVSVVDPQSNPDVAKRVISPGAPMPTYPVGSIDNQKRMSDLEGDWGVSPMSKSEVRRL